MWYIKRKNKFLVICWVKEKTLVRVICFKEVNIPRMWWQGGWKIFHLEISLCHDERKFEVIKYVMIKSGFHVIHVMLWEKSFSVWYIQKEEKFFEIWKTKFCTIFGKIYKRKKQLSQVEENIKAILWGVWWVSKGKELGETS